MLKIGFIDYYLDEWHAQNYPRWIEEAGQGKFTIGSVYGDVEGTEFGRRSNQAFCDDLGLKLASSIEEVIKDNDCLIVLSPDNPEEHPRLAELALKSAKPVYVDKTFSNTKAEAVAMFNLAAEHRTPIYSTSALRYSSAFQNLPRTELVTVLSRGGGLPYNYVVHQLEPLLMLMGRDIKRVMAWGETEAATFLLEFESGKTAALSQTSSLSFSMDLNYEDGSIVTVEAKDNYFPVMMTAMLDFFSEAVYGIVSPPVAEAETIAIMLIREMILEGLQRKGEWIERNGR